jgi:hypothetical protein
LLERVTEIARENDYTTVVLAAFIKQLRQTYT